MFEGIKKMFSRKQLPGKVQYRDFAAGRTNRLNIGFSGTYLSADARLSTDLPKIRARARKLASDNGYAKKFVKLVSDNVIGPNGIVIQSKVRNKDGTPNEKDREIIETMFKDWAKPEHCSASTMLSWIDIQRQVAEALARDGEVIVRRLRFFDNKYNYALQVLESDHLDLNYSGIVNGNNVIKMGVEYDQWKKPVAYHILTDHPGDTFFGSRTQRIRVSANDILHLYLEDRPGQTRGLSWLTSAIIALDMEKGYEEAELTAARVSASKMGIITSEQGTVYKGQGEENDGSKLTDMEPGVFEELPPGMKVQMLDPAHPAGNFEKFVKTNLRGIASGLGVSYNMLASDLEGVNYSSIRAGLIEEREVWKGLQTWVIQHLSEKIFADLLTMGLVSGTLPYSLAEYDRLRPVIWQGRRWSWVDPQSDIDASATAVENGFMSISDVILESGRDPDEVFETLKQDLEKVGELRKAMQKPVANAPKQEIAK